MKVILAAVLIIALLPFVYLIERSNDLQSIWKNCTKPGGAVTINKVFINPDPPQIGKDVNVIVSYNLNETIDSGKIKVNLVLVNSPIDTEVNLCTTIPAIGLKCPLYQGNGLTINVTQTIPNDAPTGEYKGNVVLEKSDGTQLVCVDLDFSM